ncbi:MAG: hypothetical protein Q9160_005335 [Pyrenula sp. 1 TL-2023]
MRATNNKEHGPNDAFGGKDSDDSSMLPDFDASATTEYACIGAIYLGAFACMVCLVISITTFVACIRLRNRSNRVDFWSSGYLLPLPTAAVEVLSLAMNFVFTICLESLAFVHATSLRWALYRENRLHFNTNLRLLTNAKSSGPNKWYINVISTACLILCYVATSQIFMTADDFSPSDISDAVLINPIALPILGICLLCYVVIATWAMKWNHRHVPTWSSSPITNALATRHKHLTCHGNRCLMPVHSALLSSRPTFPSQKQPSLISAIPNLSYLTIFIWTLTFLSVAWWLSIVLISRSNIVNHHPSTHWYLSMAWTRDFVVGGDVALNSVPIYIIDSPWKGYSTPNLTQHIVAIMFMTAIQGLQTVGLHSIELVVNANRDEDIWRRAAALSARDGVFWSSNIGMPRKVNPMSSALKSWPYLYLFTLKSILHWSLGQSVRPKWSPAGITLWMTHGPIFVYLILMFSLAVFTQYLCMRRPNGPQPATWGHLQTLIDLIDDWGDREGEGRLFWGDKGDGGRRDGIRHAGTSSNQELVDVARFGVLYE